MTDADAREKWSAYPNTVLEFVPPHALRIDLRQPLGDSQRRALAAAGWANRFAVFTAENPHGDNADDAPRAEDEARRERANSARRRRLHETLRERGVRMREVRASAPDGSYVEECVAVDADLADAVRMAREFDQLALFWFDGSSFWLVSARLGEPPIALPGAPKQG